MKILKQKIQLENKNKKRWNIDFPYNIINDLMEELLEGIVNCINEIKYKVKIKSLIFTGGA